MDNNKPALDDWAHHMLKVEKNIKHISLALTNLPPKAKINSEQRAQLKQEIADTIGALVSVMFWVDKN